MRSAQLVLVVEDDPGLRRMVSAQLRSLKYDVMEAADALAALESLENNCKVDLLLTDVVLSDDFNGVDLGHIARELRPRLKLMYMSGYPASAPEAGTPLEPGVRLLRKPFRRSDLATAVERALNER